ACTSADCSADRSISPRRSTLSGVGADFELAEAEAEHSGSPSTPPCGFSASPSPLFIYSGSHICPTYQRVIVSQSENVDNPSVGRKELPGCYVDPRAPQRHRQPTTGHQHSHTWCP